MQASNIISLDEKMTHSPKLSVMSNNQPGSIKLNTLPPLSPATPSRKVNFGAGADLLMNMLHDHFPLAQFAVSQRTPTVHLKDYYPERFDEVKSIIFNKDKDTVPNLIVIDGGKE